MTGYVVEQAGRVVGVAADPVTAVRCAMDDGAGWLIDSAPLTVRAVDDATYCRLRFGPEAEEVRDDAR